MKVVKKIFFCLEIIIGAIPLVIWIGTRNLSEDFAKMVSLSLSATIFYCTKKIPLKSMP